MASVRLRSSDDSGRCARRDQRPRALALDGQREVERSSPGGAARAPACRRAGRGAADRDRDRRVAVDVRRDRERAVVARPASTPSNTVGSGPSAPNATSGFVEAITKSTCSKRSAIVSFSRCDVARLDARRGVDTCSLGRSSGRTHLRREVVGAVGIAVAEILQDLDAGRRAPTPRRARAAHGDVDPTRARLARRAPRRLDDRATTSGVDDRAPRSATIAARLPAQVAEVRRGRAPSPRRGAG